MEREPGRGLEPESIDHFPNNLLAEQNTQIDIEVRAALARKKESVSEKILPRSADYLSAALVSDISEIIRRSGYDPNHTRIGRPSMKNDATSSVDLAFNTSGIAKAAVQPAEAAAETLAVNIAEYGLVADAQTAGSFVNIALDYSKAAPKIIEEVYSLGDHYGHFRNGEAQTVIVDFSSPNVAKNMTVAHLRSTIIGQSLMKIQEAAGNVPFGINHLGDWGTQFGNIIYEYKKELAERGDDFIDELNADPTATLMGLYRTFTARRESDPAAVEAAQQIFLELEQGEPELVELWDQFKAWSLRDFAPSYDRLGVVFDAFQGESFYEGKMQAVIEDGLAKNVLRTNSEGSVVFPSQPLVNPTNGAINEKVMLDAKGQPRDELLLKPTGGTVYLTRDLAAIRYRGEELAADKILYVIGKEQKSHCLELFAMADQLNYAGMGTAEHVSFGHLNVDGHKMKSRSGKVALLNDILDESVNAATGMLKDRKLQRGDPEELTDAEMETARQVGISAVIFADLKQNREKDIEFEPDVAKTLEAGSSAYIQYTNARINSILEKVGEPEPLAQTPEQISDLEKNLLLQVSQFSAIVKESSQANSPHRIASYVTDLCQAFNLFYQEQPIAKAPSDIERNFRLHVAKVTQQVIKNSSWLLHIELPNKM